MAIETRSVLCAVGMAFLAGCGSDMSGDPAPPAYLTVWPPSLVVVAGMGGVEILAYNSSRDPVIWTLDGPGSLSSPTGLATVYSPPDTLDADREVAVTATAGTLRASLSIQVVAPPFDLDPTALSVTAGDPAVPIRVLVRRSTTAPGWYPYLSGDLGSARQDGDTLWYSPPPVVPEVTTESLVVLSTQLCSGQDDTCFFRVVDVTIHPRP